MTKGELLIRITVWIALAGYTIGLLTFLMSKGNRRADSFARISWTIGAIALIAHVICAYHFAHQWSHASALQETALQTGQVYGLYWSGGLYINFILMGAWAVDALWWWLRGLEQYRRRPVFISMLWYFFLLFIFFNATVVFEDGLLRYLGVVFTFIILIVGFRAVRPATRKLKSNPSL